MQCSQELASHHYQVIVWLVVTTSCLVLLYINQSTHSLLSQLLRIAESSSAPKTICKLQVCAMYESDWYQTFRLSIPASAQDAKAALFAPSQFNPRLFQLSQARDKTHRKRDRKQNSAVTKITKCGHCLPQVLKKKHTVLNRKSRAASGPTARCPKMTSTEFRMYRPLLSKCRRRGNSWTLFRWVLCCMLGVQFRTRKYWGTATFCKVVLDSLLCSVDESSDLLRHEIHSILVDGSGECYSCESSKVKLQRHLLQPKFRCFMALLSRSLKSPE